MMRAGSTETHTAAVLDDFTIYRSGKGMTLRHLGRDGHSVALPIGPLTLRELVDVAVQHTQSCRVEP